jgi:YD repeat-containing protein
VNQADGDFVLSYIAANGNTTVGDPAPPLPSGRYVDVDGDGTVTSIDALLVSNEITRRTTNGGVNSFLTTLAQRHFTYTTPGLGLPRGLVTQERITTGRRNSAGAPIEIITDYDYVNTSNTPGATSNQLGRLRTMTVAPGTVDQAITSYSYDTRGNLTQVTDPLGRITKFYYDSRNRITASLGLDPDAAGPLLGLAQRMDYDVFDNVISTETINSFLEGAVLYVTATKTSITYNSIDRPTARYTQNPSVNWYLSGSTLAQGTTKVAGTAITSAALETYLVNANNSLIINTPLAAVANQGLITTTSYNTAGQATSVIETPVGNAAQARETKFQYDKLGRQTVVTMPNPGAGLTATPTDARSANGGFETRYEYDNLGNLNATVDGLNNRTTQAYDNLSRVVSRSLPHPTNAAAVGPTTTYAYAMGSRGWDITSTNANGQVIVQKHDRMGRQTDVSGDTPTQSWTYFVDGNLSSSKEVTLPSTSYDYTLRGQLKSVSLPPAAAGEARPVTQYTYFADGQVSSVIDPLLRTTTYSYLPSGRVGTVTQPDPDAAGSQLPSIRFGRKPSPRNRCA